MPTLRLPVHSYRLQGITASNSRLVNCYVEALPEGKQPAYLTRAPGVAAFATVGSGYGRGLHVMANVLYAVTGTTLYSVSSGGTATALGTIAGTTACSFADNGSELVIGTDGGTWYVYDGTLTAISDADFTARGARRCAFVDSYIAFVEPGSGRWFTSDLADATAYDSLDFATAEGAPDNLVTLAVDHREVILFGERSTEIWYNAGATGFPFERSPGGFIELGAVAVAGLCKADNSVFWLASDLTVRRLQGQTPQRVSHHGMEQAVRGYSTVADCQAYSYTWQGHLCVVFRFPAAAACWVYDITTGEWHERSTYSGDGWEVSGVGECYDKVLVQDYGTGAVGYLSASTYTEFGAIQRCEWTYQNIYASNQRIPHQSLEIVCETGVGLVTGQGSNPLLTLEISGDGGRTWTTLPTRTIGGQGEYQTRVKWHRLGTARDRVYRCSISDPVQLTVTDTVLETA